jgi:hypothetical protein
MSGPAPGGPRGIFGLIAGAQRLLLLVAIILLSSALLSLAYAVYTGRLKITGFDVNLRDQELKVHVDPNSSPVSAPGTLPTPAPATSPGGEVVVVLDRSFEPAAGVSPRQSQEVARELVAALGGIRYCSLLALGPTPTWVARDTGPGPEREALRQRIDGPAPDGVPALTDGVVAAAEHLRGRPGRSPGVVVVLTSSGRDRSRLAVDEARRRLTAPGSRPVVVLAVVCTAGAGATSEAAHHLGELATATGGRLVTVTPATAATVQLVAAEAVRRAAGR